MSIPTIFPHPPPPPSPPTTAGLGLGYTIGIVLGFLVILSTILISSYLCRRSRRNRSPEPPNRGNPNPSAVALPRNFWVVEEEIPNRPDSPSGVVGLDPSVINSYPKLQFVRSDFDSESRVCSICLCDYKEWEMLRMMPDCRHAFHLLCLDAWLRLNGSCPVCRNSPLPTPNSTPVSTPLVEVVPLAQFADNRRRS